MRGKTDKELPVCNDCHTAHTIRRTDEDGFKLEIMDKCGRCHEEIAKTYFDTYHGKVSQLGYTKTAKCYDCHGAHDILRVGRPALAPVAAQNVVATCQKCHPGATRRFAGYLTHATHHDPQKYPFLFWTFWGMTGAAGGHLRRRRHAHAALAAAGVADAARELKAEERCRGGCAKRPRPSRTRRPDQQARISMAPSHHDQPQYLRFSRLNRVLHVLMIVSFISLALTGHDAEVLLHRLGSRAVAPARRLRDRRVHPPRRRPS